MDCSITGSIQLLIEAGSNLNWIAIQPKNDVKSVAIDTMLSGAYNYLINRLIVANLPAVKVDLTSTTGKAIRQGLAHSRRVHNWQAPVGRLSGESADLELK